MGTIWARDVASLKLTEGHELWAGRHRVMWSPSAEGGRNKAPRGVRYLPSHPSGRGGEGDTPSPPLKIFDFSLQRELISLHFDAPFKAHTV